MDKEQKFINDFINEVNKKETEYWDKYNIKKYIFYNRYKAGWSLEDIISIPVKTRKK